MEAEIGGSAKIENDQNENPTTFCNNSNCFLQQSVAASVSQAQVYIFGQKFQQSRFCDVRWETQPQSLSFGRRTNDLVGSQGGWGNFWGRGKLLMIPLLAFGWESALEKKVIAVKSVKIDIHRRTAVLGLLRQGALYHISFVCQQEHICHRDHDGLYIQIHESLTVLKNTAPCKLAAIRSLFWVVGGGLGMGDGKENLVFMKGVLCHPLCSRDSAQSNSNWVHMVIDDEYIWTQVAVTSDTCV